MRGHDFKAGEIVDVVKVLGQFTRDRAQDGLQVEIEILGKMCPAVVVSTPLFDADGARMRG